MIRVCRFVEDDGDPADDVREIERACLKGREHEAYPVDLKSGDVEVWFAFDVPTHDPIAFGVLVNRGIDETPDRSGWHLRMCGTLPAYQRQGLQRRLIKARVAYAAEHGASTIRTYCRPDNAESMKALMVCKFKPYRPDDAYAGEMVYWRRDLHS